MSDSLGTEILQGGRQGTQKSVKCYNCGEEGHLRKDCTVVKCFRCGSLDHCVKDCKSPRKSTRRKQSTPSRERRKLVYNSSKMISSRSVATSTTDLQNTKKNSRKYWPDTYNQICCKLQWRRETSIKRTKNQEANETQTTNTFWLSIGKEER